MTEPGKVFISYAWEQPEFKEDVRVFAAWLANQLANRGDHKSEILIDFLYSITPPAEGWLTWMYNGIKHAETVLVICSPKYLDAFNKVDNGKGGRGSTYEGAIINQSIYNSYQHNTKFFPILHDNGSVDDIPDTLLPWWNGLRFPSNNETIFRLTLRENPTLLTPTQEKEEIIEIVQVIKDEDKIIQEIAESIDENSQEMLNPIQTLVRAFVTLSGVDKIRIAKTIGVSVSGLQNMKPPDLDKEILRKVKEQNLVHKLWDEVNKVHKFEDETNPFNLDN